MNLSGWFSIAVIGLLFSLSAADASVAGEAGVPGYHGYIYSAGHFTTLDAPGTVLANPYTLPQGVNNSGEVVGEYGSATGLHSFTYVDGTYTIIPNRASGYTEQTIGGVNDAGQIVGGDQDGAFLYSAGTFTTISDPLGIFPGLGDTTFANGINDSGEIVGSYLNTSGKTQGFLFSGGAYHTLIDPMATLVYTNASGINNLGDIVGYYLDGSGIHGFLDDGGIYSTLDDPLTGPSAYTGGRNMDTVATGINDLGQIVGDYYNASGVHGFIYTDGVYSTIDAPMALTGGLYDLEETTSYGINNAGQVVGGYYGGVPEPSTWMLMLVGFGGLGVLVRSTPRTTSPLKA